MYIFCIDNNCDDMCTCCMCQHDQCRGEQIIYGPYVLQFKLNFMSIEEVSN